MKNQIRGHRIHKASTTLKSETIDGRSYFRVEFKKEQNTIMPAPFLAKLINMVGDPDFAFGVVDAKLVFLFRNRQDAKSFQKGLLQVLPGNNHPPARS